MTKMFIVAWRDKETREVCSDWCSGLSDAETEAWGTGGVCFEVASPIDFTNGNFNLSFDFAQACAETIGKHYLKEAGLWVIPTDKTPA